MHANREKKQEKPADSRRIFGTKCAKCGIALLPSDYVLRCFQKVFHAHCFQCFYCTRLLKKGDQYVLADGQIICQQDYAHIILHRNQQPHYIPSTTDVCAGERYFYTTILHKQGIWFNYGLASKKQ
ncbi:LIM domain-containing protein [Ditylenchus destructor]|uniref:LIM domain-containing protein n=1 Tax=Ditylenchus destructor TaxID=166010 RepID=A0AAD4NBW9_9BILA|nr:LIM domain-containing protein [Ditylenchus destructor]